jgi:hypothetical protein
MKINLSPMIKLRAEATERVNQYFNSFALNEAHRSLAYRRKIEIASSVVSGGAAPAAFTEEAKLRGIVVEALAQLVLSKRSAVDDRELDRQKTMILIDQAKSAEGLAEVVKSYPILGR